MKEGRQEGKRGDDHITQLAGKKKRRTDEYGREGEKGSRKGEEKESREG
jgi:hypothetical protein